MAVAVGKNAVIVVGAKNSARSARKPPPMSATTSTAASAGTSHFRDVAIIATLPESRCTGSGSSARGPAVVGRLPGVECTAAESERVVEERLQELRRLEVRHVRGVVEAAGHRLTLSVVWYLAAPGIALARLSRFFSSTSFTLFSRSSVGASSFSLSATSPINCLDTADVLASRSDDRLAALDEHAEQVVGVEDQACSPAGCAPTGFP